MKISVKKTETKNNIKSADAIPEAENPIPKLLQNSGRKFLSQLKQKALRQNSWFRVLSFDKRRLIDAVIQTVNNIHSSLLLKILTPLANKLLQAIGGMRGLMGKLAFDMESTKLWSTDVSSVYLRVSL